MKTSQSNFNLQLPSSYLARSYLIATVTILLISNMVVERWNRRFGCETIHPTENLISMNLLEMSWVGMIFFDL